MTELVDALHEPGGLLRHVNALLCIAAAGGLFWRLIGRWDVTEPLWRAVVGAFAVLELIGAFGAARAAALNAPVNEAAYAILVHGFAVLALIALWPRLARIIPAERIDP